MTKIEVLFLKIKAWQFFLLLFIPYILTIVADNVGVGVIVSCGLVTVFYAWLWALGSKLYNLASKEKIVRFNIFRFCIFFSSAFVFCSIFVEAGFGLIIPDFIEIFFLICMIYVSYFVAKNLTMGERYNIADPLEVYTLTLLVFCFPIGVWFIQPKVNKLFRENID